MLDCAADCHAALPHSANRRCGWAAKSFAGMTALRNFVGVAGVVLAAGLRPCSGALIILVFALANGLLWAGVAATFAMALGTALTTGALAAFAVLFKRAALSLAGGRSGTGGLRALLALECLAAAFVAVLGLTLLFGLWTGAGQS